MKRVFAAIWVFAALSTGQALACVGCRTPGSDTIANEPQTALAGMGFSWAVLIMLTVVLSLLGGMVTYICRTVARLDAARSLQ